VCDGMVRVERKIPNGKLVRIDVEFNGEYIRAIKITGDFFMYPEDAITNIERELAGVVVSELERKLPTIITNNCEEVIGFSTDDLAGIIREAYERRQ